MPRKIPVPVGLILALALVATTVAAAPEPELPFGPTTFEVTSDSLTLYEESFDAAQNSAALLHVRNGDGEGSRVDAVTITLNGQTVVSGPDTDTERPGLIVPIQLQAGTNELEIALDGAPGSFIAMAISPPGAAPRFVTGRLVLPWGRNDEGRSLSLALKNGSPRFPRAARIVFFRPDGSVAGASTKIHLPPRGSIALSADDWIEFGDWSIGSVEVFYTGPGVARVFGSARQLERPLLLEVESLPLADAGFHLYRGHPDTAPAAPRRRGF